MGITHRGSDKATYGKVCYSIYQSSTACTPPNCAPNELGRSSQFDDELSLPAPRLRRVQFLRAAAHERHFKSGVCYYVLLKLCTDQTETRS